MNKKGDFGTGLFVLTIVVIATIVLAGMATQTSSIFGAFNTSDWGVIGFVVNHFNLILFVGLTLAAFIAIGAFGRGD